MVDILPTDNNNLRSLLSFIPELIIMEGMLSIILLEIMPSRRKYIYSSTLGVIVLSFIAVLFSLNSSGSQLFMNLIVVDPFSTFFKIIFLISTLVIIMVSKSSVEIKDDIKAEYYFLLLVILLGMFLMVSSINLLMIYLAIELVSIPSYILAGMSKNNKSSNEASLKYVIFGSFASGLMLFGLSWLYGVAGSTNIFEIQKALVESGNSLMVFMALLFISFAPPLAIITGSNIIFLTFIFNRDLITSFTTFSEWSIPILIASGLISLAVCII